MKPVTDSWGTPLLPLENAILRFVPATDGRGEGLAGVDITVADRFALTTAAKNRGCDVDGDTILICGTRFKMVS